MMNMITKEKYFAPESEEIVLMEKLMANQQSQLEDGTPGDEWDDFS